MFLRANAGQDSGAEDINRLGIRMHFFLEEIATFISMVNG